MQQVLEHYRYLSDSARLDGYERALTAVVREGDVVLDLGAGTGVLGFLAVQAGAARVYAVDRSDMIVLARRNSVNNELHATAIHGDSNRIELPEKVDVVVCDQMGPLGFDAGLLQALHDARIRHLRPGGTLVPCRLDLEIAPVTANEVRHLLDFWASRPHGMDLSAVHEWAMNQQYEAELGANAVLGETIAGPAFTTGFSAAEPFRFVGTSAVRRPGQLDAIAIWFVAALTHSVEISNSPLRSDALARTQAVLPLKRPLHLELGDVVKIDLRANPRSGALSWALSVVRDACVQASEQRSTLLGTLFDSASLSQLSPNAVPSLSRRGEARRHVLQLVDGRRTRAQIERSCGETFPSLFEDDLEMQQFVYEVLNDAGA